MRPWLLLSAFVVTALLMAPLAAAPKPPGSGPKPTPPPPEGPADPAVAYTHVTGWDDDVWNLGVMNANGTAATTIYTAAPTPEAPAVPAEIRHPTWAPDRSAIAFMVVHTHPELWRIDVTVAIGAVQGTNPLLLLATYITYNPYYYTDISPAWSPDGTVIAFTEEDTDPSLFWYEYAPLMKLVRTIPASGGTPTTLYTTEDMYGASDLTWSHDSTKIAWVSTRFIDTTAGSDEYYPVLEPVEYSIMVLDIPTNTTRTVFGPVTYRLYDLDGARTQDKIAFYAYSPVSGIYTVDIRQPDAVPQLVFAGGYSPTWLPDDAKIAFNAPEYHWRTGKLIGWPIWTYEFSTAQKVRVGPGWDPDWVRCGPCP